MRVPRTFAFVDLSGFTNYTAAFGDDAAGRLLGAFRAIARDVASERGVRIAKWLGDGCMIVAINQLDCIAFSIELEHKAKEVCSPLGLRVGIATGHALLFEGDDYIGSAVNLAARLCDAAADGQVLVSQRIAGAVEGSATLEEIGELALKGLSQAVAVYNIASE